MEYERGDVVQLKSGGIPMVVSVPKSTNGVECMWHNKNGEPQTYYYNVDLLKPIITIGGTQIS